MGTWLLCMLLDYHNAQPVCVTMSTPTQCYAELDNWLVRAHDWSERSGHLQYMAGCAPWAIVPPYLDRNVMAAR